MINILTRVLSNTDKINKLSKLLDLIDWDDESKTLTVDSSINIKVKGEYKMDVDTHVRINSNYLESDPELNIPYSVWFNSDELDFRRNQKIINDILK